MQNNMFNSNQSMTQPYPTTSTLRPTNTSLSTWGSNISQTSSIPGRIVFSTDQITPQDIPSNGTAALFPLSDGSAIFARALLPNGTFDEQKYILVTPEIKELLTQGSENAVTIPSGMEERLSTLEKEVRKLSNMLRNRGKNNQKTGKQVTNGGENDV